MSFWVNQWLPFIYGSHEMIKPTRGIELLNPYEKAEVRNVCNQFYSKYFQDRQTRTVIMGINPGRLGAGVTGISFTDPEKLQAYCEIDNDFPKQQELSSKFIYDWISRVSSVSDFYKRFIILSVCPIGFVTKGKNINYYDEKLLQSRAEKLIIAQQNLIHEHGDIGETAFMLGKGKNFNYFKKLNSTHGWYKEIVPLPHPRWVMQYRFKTRFEWMDDMLRLLKYSSHD